MTLCKVLAWRSTMLNKRFYGSSESTAHYFATHLLSYYILLSACPLLNAYYFAVNCYKRMCLTTNAYGINDCKCWWLGSVVTAQLQSTGISSQVSWVKFTTMTCYSHYSFCLITSKTQQLTIHCVITHIQAFISSMQRPWNGQLAKWCLRGLGKVSIACHRECIGILYTPPDKHRCNLWSSIVYDPQAIKHLSCW